MSDQLAQKLIILRPIDAGIATYEELDTRLSLDDLLVFNAYLDVKDDYEKLAQEKQKK